jgi:hypothetical protein
MISFFQEANTPEVGDDFGSIFIGQDPPDNYFLFL